MKLMTIKESGYVYYFLVQFMIYEYRCTCYAGVAEWYTQRT